MASPTEIQKFTISSEFLVNQNKHNSLYFKHCILICNSFPYSSQFILEMMGELYTVHEMPEQPKEGFFKGLFGGGAKLLDREELCE